MALSGGLGAKWYVSHSFSAANEPFLDWFDALESWSLPLDDSTKKLHDTFGQPALRGEDVRKCPEMSRNRFLDISGHFLTFRSTSRASEYFLFDLSL